MSVCNEKRSSWVKPKMSWEYVARTIREEYPYLKKVKHDDAELQKKKNLLQRAIKLYGDKETLITNNVPEFKTKFKTYRGDRRLKLNVKGLLQSTVLLTTGIY